MSRFMPQSHETPDSALKIGQYIEEIKKAVALAEKNKKPFRLTIVAKMIGPSCDGHLLIEAWQRFSAGRG